VDSCDQADDEKDRFHSVVIGGWRELWEVKSRNLGNANPFATVSSPTQTLQPYPKQLRLIIQSRDTLDTEVNELELGSCEVQKLVWIQRNRNPPLAIPAGLSRRAKVANQPLIAPLFI
jgi:hypothetical protein